MQRVLWCTISGRVKNSVRSACRPVKPPFCFAKPLVRLYAARGVHCLLPAFAHAQSWPLLTNPQPFLATSPRETNTSACAKCESVPKGMVRQKAATFVAAFLGAPSGLSRALKRPTGAFLPAGPAAGPSCSRHPMVHQIEPSLKDCNKKRAAISCNAYFGAPSGTRTQDPLIKSQLLYQLS